MGISQRWRENTEKPKSNEKRGLMLVMCYEMKSVHLKKITTKHFICFSGFLSAVSKHKSYRAN